MTKRQRQTYRLFGKVLFILYIAFLVYFLIFSERYGREPGSASYQYNLVPFQEIRRFWEYRDQLGFLPSFTNLFGNVLIFIPFGFFFPMASRSRSLALTVFLSFMLSLAVEMGQFITQVGSFDIDDLLLNTLGGLIGYMLYALSHRVGVNRHRRRNRAR